MSSRHFDDNRAVWLVGAPAAEVAPPLARDLTVDVAIVGGGVTGVSTAYHLSRRFPERAIALLDARALGNGASGRNGGLMLNGIAPFATDPGQIAREHALTREAIDALVALARELGVRHRRDGVVKLATSARAAEEEHALVEALRPHGIALEYLDRAALDARFPAARAHGAVLDPTEGMINGVDLIRAMRPRLVERGVQIFEGTRVTAIRDRELVTPGGRVRAGAIVLATNGYTPQLGWFSRGILPVISHVVATDPLPRELLSRTIGPFAGFHDDLPRLAYASVDPDGRLIVGGGSNASYGYRFGNQTAAEPSGHAESAIRNMLAAYFPALADVRFAHRWSGPLGLTLRRHCAIGAIGKTYYALGYSGHGVVLGNLAGRVLTDLYAGEPDRWRGYAFFDARPSGIPPEPLRWLGYQLYTRVTGRSPFRKI